jgi:hypothetical protein
MMVPLQTQRIARISGVRATEIALGRTPFSGRGCRLLIS